MFLFALAAHTRYRPTEQCLEILEGSYAHEAIFSIYRTDYRIDGSDVVPGYPTMAEGSTAEPPSGNPPPAGVIERIFDSVVEKLASAWLEEAPAPINPVSEIEKLEKNIKRSPLPEYEQLVKDAEKTGADGVRPFYERLAELIERFRSLSADDDQPGPGPGPRPTLPPYCPGCSNENGN